jgi:hypothetical protein
MLREAFPDIAIHSKTRAYLQENVGSSPAHPHPALRATFSRMEKEKSSSHTCKEPKLPSLLGEKGWG